jgi:hypothetical protein
MNTNVAPTALRPIGQYVNARVSVRSSDFGNFPKAIASFGNYTNAAYPWCLLKAYGYHQPTTKIPSSCSRSSGHMRSIQGSVAL